MANIESLKRFYLENYDFQVFVNKNIQAYKFSIEKELSNPIAVEYYESLQKGGCNESKDHNRGV